MSNHEPECPARVDLLNDLLGQPKCICSALRACEKRVYEKLTRHDMHSGLACLTNYQAGLRDAREAVAALPSWNYTYGGNPPMVEGPPQYGAWMVKSKALAAIDALR